MTNLAQLDMIRSEYRRFAATYSQLVAKFTKEELVMEAEECRKKMKACNEGAFHYANEANSLRHKDCNVLDLHNLQVDEAVGVVEQFLDSKIKSLANGKSVQVTLITGHGQYRGPGAGQIKMRTLEYLANRHLFSPTKHRVLPGHPILEFHAVKRLMSGEECRNKMKACNEGAFYYANEANSLRHNDCNVLDLHNLQVDEALGVVKQFLNSKIKSLAIGKSVQSSPRKYRVLPRHPPLGLHANKRHMKIGEVD
ncbi:hypothetical protein Bhyg_06438 [Pseudolycoriella hygida]|uniref:Smr domain-containing protein n=1 Tax=Pseudolycoriella hygida TaxID=35572 RepID=A0A9Q0N2M7_9DIPT|nr:hypothetical protein Bhyg_06438 [Pseudolycoriella hygida]